MCRTISESLLENVCAIFAFVVRDAPITVVTTRVQRPLHAGTDVYASPQALPAADFLRDEPSTRRAVRIVANAAAFDHYPDACDNDAVPFSWQHSAGMAGSSTAGVWSAIWASLSPHLRQRVCNQIASLGSARDVGALLTALPAMLRPCVAAAMGPEARWLLVTRDGWFPGCARQACGRHAACTSAAAPTSSQD